MPRSAKMPSGDGKRGRKMGSRGPAPGTGGRPVDPELGHALFRLSFRMHAADKARLDSLCERFGMRPGDAVRHAIMLVFDECEKRK